MNLKEPVSLSTFMLAVSSVIKANFSDSHWIQIEVSKFTDRGTNSHAYFDFIEYDDKGKEIAKAKGSLWSSNKTKILAKFKQSTGSNIQDGMKLLLRLSASFSAQYGFSFVVEDIDPAYTLGDMEAKLNAMRQSLIEVNLYTRNKGLPAPSEFMRVAVISPEGAAGLGDFMREADSLQSHGLCSFNYYTALFQGKDAPLAISSALRLIYKEHKQLPFDALVIIRGGGASSDLAWLNDHELASLVCRIPIPVLTGIGHLVDNTILDEVANIRFDTPSKVSAYIAGSIVSNAELAINNMQAITKGAQQAITISESLLDSSITGINTIVHQVILKCENDCKNLLDNIFTSANNHIVLSEKSLGYMISEVIGLSPKKTLERGYAIVRDDKGNVLTNIDKVKACFNIDIEMRDGRVEFTSKTNSG